MKKTFVQQGPWPWSPKREIPAVRGVDLALRPGEVVALVGQSGSGKTTLARILLGLTEPSAGEVWLDGLRWDGMSERERHPHRKRFQYVPQDAMSALNPQQTALEHVAETLRVLGGQPRAEARTSAREMLRRLGLDHRLHELPRSLSGGEQRRVTLARVLALTPRLVVADEPTSGLEADRREAVLESLIGNLPDGAACVLVTHEMAEARRWADRVLVMLDGRVIEEFPPKESDPLHPYAQLLFAPWDHPVPEGGLAASGCPFRPGCPLPDQDPAAPCAGQVPSLEGPGTHRVACHLRSAYNTPPPPATLPKEGL